MRAMATRVIDNGRERALRDRISSVTRHSRSHRIHTRGDVQHGASVFESLSRLQRLRRITMWETPSLFEVKMDAEIGSYQEDERDPTHVPIVEADQRTDPAAF